MAPNLATIVTLTPSKARYQITARATRIWEVEANEADKPYSLDMVLLDQEGDQIHATIPRRLINQYAETLKEGPIYRIQHFEVVESARSYRPVTSTNNIIKWTSFTSIVEDNQSLPIAKHNFEFYPIDNLAQRTNKLDHLIVRNYSFHKMACRNHNVRVTLWGKTADLIEESTIINCSEQKVVIITSTKVVDFKGETQVQSTYATKVYVNLEIPETRKLMERLAYLQKKHHILHIVYILKQKLKYIEWRYISCTNCKSGLNEEGKCRECKNKIDCPIQR
ncbi:hypothetical protein RND81_09G080700 [Saponaria officinalis]|uniref:Replication protein A 70 kDa DNA-binding subunit B/D first OB fold domain-containing protein n=1 Tax=Saponaria officinalis TaxID=3572 RepID=A0AAW1IKC0_SAPOF